MIEITKTSLWVGLVLTWAVRDVHDFVLSDKECLAFIALWTIIPWGGVWVCRYKIATLYLPRMHSNFKREFTFYFFASLIIESFLWILWTFASIVNLITLAAYKKGLKFTLIFDSHYYAFKRTTYSLAPVTHKLNCIKTIIGL